MKKFLLAALAVSALALSAPAHAERGGWLYMNDPNSPERLQLEYSDGSIIVLSGIEDNCGDPGDSYEDIRKILTDNGKRQRISWKIQKRCGNLAKICVADKFQKKACSAYEILDLKSWDVDNFTWRFNSN